MRRRCSTTTPYVPMAEPNSSSLGSQRPPRCVCQLTNVEKVLHAIIILPCRIATILELDQFCLSVLKATNGTAIAKTNSFRPSAPPPFLSTVLHKLRLVSPASTYFHSFAYSHLGFAGKIAHAV